MNVSYKEKLDRNYKLYIPKFLRENSFGGLVTILPLGRVALLYPSDTRQKKIREDLFNFLSEGEGFTDQELSRIYEDHEQFFRESIIEAAFDSAYEPSGD
jgi:hypothetical protein